MADSEIVNALDTCKSGICTGCPYQPMHSSVCLKKMESDVLDLLKRQQAEIEQLKKEHDNLVRNYKECAMEAVKDFAKRLKARYKDFCVAEGDMAYVIYEILKEMEGNNE